MEVSCIENSETITITFNNVMEAARMEQFMEKNGNACVKVVKGWQVSTAVGTIKEINVKRKGIVELAARKTSLVKQL